MTITTAAAESARNADYPAQRQSNQALIKANAVRLGMAELRLELGAGAISLAEAIHDERADRMPIHRLLTAQRRWGDARAGRLLFRLHISERRQCQQLTLRQKAEIVAEVLR